MPESKEKMVSRHAFSVAYNGDGRKDNHSIDVEALAPALVAFGKLIREANVEFNGKKATANVMVVSDFEHKCFQINFELALSFYEQLKTLIGTDDVIAAKSILEWLGLIATGTLGTLTFLEFLKWKRGRKIESVQKLTDQDASGSVVVTIEGEKNTVTNHVYNLTINPKALRATRDAFLPVGRDGFDRLELRQDSAIVEIIEPVEVEAILASCVSGLAENDDVDPEVERTTAWLSVYSPVYDLTADKWRFRYGKEIIYADISETKIAEDALLRGGAPANDSYQVKLEITTKVDGKGKKSKPSYRIEEVIRFIPATPPLRQTDLFPPGNEDNRTE